jgi:hydroxymethylpyrimidine/phosphomethylpyrimidine kinase
MLGSAGNVEALVNVFREWEPKNVVLDTVFSSTSGYTLLTKGGIEALKEKLIPLCSAITPNIPEAQILTGDKLLSKKDMERAALILNKRYKVDVIITGGHLENECSDLLFSNGVLTWFSGKKVSGQSHGTGCKFSSAIAANLALGYPLNECVQKAKAYVVERILGDASN